MSTTIIDPANNVRIVKTTYGLLFVPLTDQPMSAEFQQEFDAWQSLDAAGWDAFPYEISE